MAPQPSAADRLPWTTAPSRPGSPAAPPRGPPRYTGRRPRGPGRPGRDLDHEPGALPGVELPDVVDGRKDLTPPAPLSGAERGEQMPVLPPLRAGEGGGGGEVVLGARIHGRAIRDGLHTLGRHAV